LETEKGDPDVPRVVHFEIPADDPVRAVKFYEAVFGWKIGKWDGPEDYWLAMTGDEGQPGINGAITGRGEPTTVVVNTMDVASVDDAIARVVANGGTVLMPKMPVPGVGYLAYFRDTEGNAFGMMQNDPSAH
jgi:predicted enzyme related to lactoylglutathione lyase